MVNTCAVSGRVLISMPNVLLSFHKNRHFSQPFLLGKVFVLYKLDYCKYYQFNNYY